MWLRRTKTKVSVPGDLSNGDMYLMTLCNSSAAVNLLLHGDGSVTWDSVEEQVPRADHR